MSHSIYPTNSLLCNLPFIVLGIGYEDNQPHILRKEGFPVPQIFICKSGEGVLKVNEIEYIIKQDSFFFLAANTPHEYYGNTNKWEVNWISFSGNQIDNVLSELKFEGTVVDTLGNIHKIEALFKRIYDILKSDDPFGRITSSRILYDILVEFYITIHNSNAAISDGNRIINAVKHYIDEHYDQNITLEELSTLMDITPQYLCRLFKKHLHLRPFQYIAMKRIQNAKTLLSDNKLSIQEIAHKVGFSDCSYFCAIFKKYEMISPSEFKGL